MTPRSSPDPASTAPFEFDSTAAEVVEGIDLSGKRAIVTGGSSGIGIETARALACAGAAVTLAVRDTEAGKRTAAEIATTTGNDASTSVGSISQTRHRWPPSSAPGRGRCMCSSTTPRSWDRPSSSSPPMAGSCTSRSITSVTFRLPSACTTHLLPPAVPAIVSVSSEAHQLSPVIFDDVHFGSRAYDPRLAYAQSKTANVLFAVEVARRWAGDGITANAVHPGAISSTSLARHIDPDVLADLIASSTYEYKTCGQGAATSVFVATSPLLDGHHWPLLRGLPGSTSSRTGHSGRSRVRRCRLRPRPRQRRAPVGTVAQAARKRKPCPTPSVKTKTDSPPAR